MTPIATHFDQLLPQNIQESLGCTIEVEESVRVMRALDALASLYDGRMCVLPQTKKHAQDMYVIAEASWRSFQPETDSNSRAGYRQQCDAELKQAAEQIKELTALSEGQKEKLRLYENRLVELQFELTLLKANQPQNP